jgi:predicted transposase/invertase (TIGR01784 family)
MAKFINPFTDFGFKKLFGEESSKEILISFLNDLLVHESGTIVDITYLNTEQFGQAEDHRKSFFDIYCKNENDEYFIVEIQRASHLNFKERMLYYSTFPIQQQAKKGDWDFTLTAVYVIAILNFEIDEKKGKEHKIVSHVQLLETESKEVFYPKLTYIFLEMPKFTKGENELETSFDKWLFLLRYMEQFERYPDKLKEKIFMKFLEKAELAKLSEQDRNRYEYSLKVYRDERLVQYSREVEKKEFEQVRKDLAKARNEVDQARNEVNQAREELNYNLENLNRIEQEKLKLIENSKELALKTAVEIAKNAYQEGLSISSIARMTGLSEEEISKHI